jgi:hypothetical protein
LNQFAEVSKGETSIFVNIEKSECIIWRCHVQSHQFLESGHAVGCPDLHPALKAVALELIGELGVVNEAILVGVNSCHQLVNLSRCKTKAKSADCISEFNPCHEAVAIFIELVEDLLESLG